MTRTIIVFCLLFAAACSPPPSQPDPDLVACASDPVCRQRVDDMLEAARQRRAYMMYQYNAMYGMPVRIVR